MAIMPQCWCTMTTRLVLALCGMISACAPRASSVGGPLNGPSVTVTYSCQSVLSLKVRIESTSASVVVDGDGPYTLPQVASRMDYAVYADGTRTLEVFRGRVSFGIGRGVLQACAT
jgi:hypothetical protein